MLINIRVNDEKEALDFINDVLTDLGKNKTKNTHYSDEELKIAPEVRAEHSSEGPNDITIDNYLNLSITVGDLDFTTQSVINKRKNLLHRL